MVLIGNVLVLNRVITKERPTDLTVSLSGCEF